METDQLIARPYQVHLEEIAVRKNTIIHLPTGSGKTFIAISLITRFRDALRRPWGQGGKRTFFLVNTVPLVTQQRKVIKTLCPVKSVGGYSSEDRVDYWNKQKWDEELTINEVIVMTSQILSDMLTHKYIRIEDINLLIFDECHHAVEDHPMRLVMKHFEDCPLDKHPRVLGLTATLLNANVSLVKVQETLKDLETTFHATIATVNELGEVLNYSTNPHELVMYYDLPQITPDANTAIAILEKVITYITTLKLPNPNHNPALRMRKGQLDITTDPKKIVKAVKNMVVDMVDYIKDLGIYGGSLAILAYTILLERLKRKSLSREESTMYTFTITLCVKARLVLLRLMENDTGYEKIVKHSSPHVLKLLDVLKEYRPDVFNNPFEVLKVNHSKKPLSAIIFTKQRSTAKILYNLLKDVQKENPKEFGFLKHDFIVGLNVNPFKCSREQYYTKKASQIALLKFANKELNCLIATSVIEEGVDIPQCLLVMRYDPPLEYRSYIQSKGRARSSESSFVILINAENVAKFRKQYQAFQDTERYIQKLLIGNAENRVAPTQEDIREGLYDEDDIPPYITPNGGRLSSVAAISLLNRYCSVLPHDQFTIITPVWVLEKKLEEPKTLYKVIIIMPIACPIKEEIVGDLMTNLKSAKRSAALKTCIKLYEMGELHPDTLLPRHYGTVDFEQPDVKSCFLNWPWNKADEDEEQGLPKPGTKKRIRKHKKAFPTYLNGKPLSQSGEQKFYLHIIRHKTAFGEPKDSRERALYKLLQQREGFGFLTMQPLPKVCDFPMFIKIGEVTTSILTNHAVVPLKKNVFELVKQFHFFLFDKILEVAKTFVTFDGTVNTLFVVPVIPDAVNTGYDIDWDVMQTYKDIRPVIVPSYDERRKLQVTDDYKLSVVSPWYRGALLPGRYIVSNVLEYMTPQSKFDSDCYLSYEDYYSKKYNLEILARKDQPLLEVCNISSKMNCLLPRAATLKEFTEKQRKMIAAAELDDNPKGFAEIFIPEFCIKYDFPGVLWYKGMMLPSVIHRVYMLLVAHELRAEITNGTKYGKSMLSQGEEWKAIENNREVAIKSLLSQVEEPAAVNSVDRINNPIDSESQRPNIVSMQENVYQLQKKKISKEYPWDEKIEPIDIDRNISTVTVVDIECYDEFVSAPLFETADATPTMSPPRAPVSAAILPPPLKYNDKIELLSKTLTGRGPELRDILTAITTIKCHDSFNLERAETLGDSFLKFAASLYLFHKFPTLNEGQLTNIKGRLIGNRNLYYAGERIRLGGRMKTEQFSPRKDFMVPGFFAPEKVRKFMTKKQIRPTFLIGIVFPKSEALSGRLSDESWSKVQQRFNDCDGAAEKEPLNNVQNAMQCYVQMQAVSDKSIADSVEAIIGTYLLSGGITGAVKILEWTRILPPKDNFEQYLKKKVPTPLTEKKVDLPQIEFILNNFRSDVEGILGYKFRDPSFLLEALSHPSYIRNRITRSYERLEFLGDAILDFLITSHIFENCGDLKPGELTDLRSALVNNVTFASYVVKLGLHKYICSQLNPCLDSAIIKFVEHQEERNHEIVEDVLYLIDEEDCQIAEYVEVPKVLSDIFESLVGAMFLDSGGNLTAVWRVVYRIMCREIDKFSVRIPLQPVRVLYESIHACPQFGIPAVTNTEVPKVMVPVTVTKNGRQFTVNGFGGNKFQAKRAAAKLALKILGL